ncbi:MAG: hypothetical protein IPP33_06085 [Flavobacteriales bacterium]|nr:hypothetical protein [Flavobacteriales bacterium]
MKFLAGLEREDRKSIFWTPAIAKNSHDGFMAGLVLHNTTLPNQRFEWVAVPLYGTKSERLAGGARFMWNHDRLRSAWFRNVHVGVSGFAASLGRWKMWTNGTSALCRASSSTCAPNRTKHKQTCATEA